MNAHRGRSIWANILPTHVHSKNIMFFCTTRTREEEEDSIVAQTRPDSRLNNLSTTATKLLMVSRVSTVLCCAPHSEKTENFYWKWGTRLTSCKIHAWGAYLKRGAHNAVNVQARMRPGRWGAHRITSVDDAQIMFSDFVTSWREAFCATR